MTLYFAKYDEGRFDQSKYDIFAVPTELYTETQDLKTSTNNVQNLKTSTNNVQTIQ